MRSSVLQISSALGLCAAATILIAGCGPSQSERVARFQEMAARAQEAAEQARASAGSAQLAADTAEETVQALVSGARIQRTASGLIIYHAAPKPALTLGTSRRDLSVSPIPGHAPML